MLLNRKLVIAQHAENSKQVRDAIWLRDKIAMAGVWCLRDEFMTWEQFVEASPACYIAYYDPQTSIGEEIRSVMAELRRSKNMCAYYEVVSTLPFMECLERKAIRIRRNCRSVICRPRGSGHFLTQSCMTTTTKDSICDTRIRVGLQLTQSVWLCVQYRLEGINPGMPALRTECKFSAWWSTVPTVLTLPPPAPLCTARTAKNGRFRSVLKNTVRNGVTHKYGV